MNNIHPFEKELQQYALGKSDVNLEITAHIESCPDCQAEVSTYQMLFSEIKEQPSASFDFVCANRKSAWQNCKSICSWETNFKFPSPP